MVDNRDQRPDDQGARDAFLSAMLSLIVVSGVTFFTFVLCGGVVIYFVAVVAGLAVLGYIHYLLWGQALTEEVAGEREEEEAHRRAEEDDAWSRDEPFRHHRL